MDSVITIRRRMKKYNIPTVQKQKHTHESIRDAVKEVKATFPEMGARSMVNMLREANDIYVTEYGEFQFIRRNSYLTVLDYPDTMWQNFSAH